MAKQVVGLFDTTQDAHGAVQALRDAGFNGDDISVIVNESRGGDYATDGGSEAVEGAGAGATGGAVLGGLGGLLVGLGALVIPGIGPVIAAGTLATALGTAAVGAGLGAAAGGLVGALVGAGIPEDDAGVYAEGVRRGGALVTVQAASDDDAERAADILDSYNVVDIDERSATYRSGGWSGFDENTDVTAPSDSAESEWDRSSKAGTAVGGVAGAAAGAAIGSVAGPVGTVVGGVAGAMTGAGVGAAGDAAGEAASEAGMGERSSDIGGSDYGTVQDASRVLSPASSTADARTEIDTVGSGMTGVPTGASMGAAGGPVGTVAGGMTTPEYTSGTNADATRDAQGDFTTRSSATDMGGGANYSTSSVSDAGDNVALRGNDSAVVDDSPQSEWDRSSKAGTAGGALAGAATGAAIGSVGGPVGTVVGGVAGAVTGAGVGAAGDAAGEAATEQVVGDDSYRTRPIDTSASTRYDDVSSTVSDDEGPIERGLGNAEAGTERATGLDLNQSGDVGDRDRRDNY